MTTKNPRLCEIIAVVDGTKNRTKDKLTAAHHALQKPELFSGHQKTYRPKGDDVTSELGEQLPSHARSPVAAEMGRHPVPSFRAIGQRGEELADAIGHLNEVRGIHVA